MQAVDAVIRDRLHSEVVLVRQVAEYIIGSGGKRLRPALVILAPGPAATRGGHHHQLAAVVEFIHTATLLHDDVVDDSSMRRGRATANSRVRQPRHRAGRRFPLFARLPDDGGGAEHARHGGARRCHQHHRRGRGAAAPERPRRGRHRDRHYLHVIRYKTAKLFEAAGRLGAILAGGRRDAGGGAGATTACIWARPSS